MQITIWIRDVDGVRQLERATDSLPKIWLKNQQERGGVLDHEQYDGFVFFYPWHQVIKVKFVDEE